MHAWAGGEGEDHADAGTWHSEVREKQLRNERAELGEVESSWQEVGGRRTRLDWIHVARGEMRPRQAGCARHPSSSFAYFLSLSY